MVQFCGLVKDGRVLQEKLYYGEPPAESSHGKWLPIVGNEPLYDPEFQELRGPMPAIEYNKIRLVWNVVDLPLPVVKANHKAKLSAIRWTYSNAGTTWLDPNDIERQLDTTDSVIMKMIGGTLLALLATMNNMPFSINWKFLDGSFLNLDTNLLIRIFFSVAMYIEACYDTESMYVEQIDAAQTPEAVVAINITKGWPRTPNTPNVSTIMNTNPPIDTSVHIKDYMAGGGCCDGM